MAIGDHKKTDKLHRYILAGIGRGQSYMVYRCMHADGACGHYLPVDQAIGRDTICWRCGGVCKVPKGRPETPVKRPHCVTCTKVYKRNGSSGKSDIDVKKIEKMTIDELLGDIDFDDDEEK